MNITLPHGGKTVDLVNALRACNWQNEHALIGALPMRLGAMHAAYGAPLGALTPKGSTTSAALVLSSDAGLPAWQVVQSLNETSGFPRYLMTEATFRALRDASITPQNETITVDGRVCVLCAAYLDVDRVGESWERTSVDRAHVAILLPYPLESSANVITIPHGGIVDESSDVIRLPHTGIVADKASQ